MAAPPQAHEAHECATHEGSRRRRLGRHRNSLFAAAPVVVFAAALRSALPSPSVAARDGVAAARPAEMVAAALRAAGQHSDPGWRARARWAALLPRISVRLLHGQGYASYFDLRPDAPDAWDANSRSNLSIEVRASWSLDRLVFDRREIAAADAELRAGQARRQLAKRVLQLLFRQQELEQLLEPAIDATAEQRISRRTELARNKALLQHLTGGAFLAKPDLHPLP